MQKPIEAFIDGCSNAGIDYVEHYDHVKIDDHENVGQKIDVETNTVTIEVEKGSNSTTVIKFHFTRGDCQFIKATSY